MVKLTQIQTNISRVEVGQKVIYFSYDTPIAYYDYVQEEMVVSENVWTRTTARHINIVKEQAKRHVQLPHEEFVLCLKDYSIY